MIALNIRFTLGSADDPAGKAPRVCSPRPSTRAPASSIHAFQVALKDQSISLGFAPAWTPPTRLMTRHQARLSPVSPALTNALIANRCNACANSARQRKDGPAERGCGGRPFGPSLWPVARRHSTA